ncbi:MAG: glycoside hydrolase family 43 protein [Clostridia bacterium]|nr:glycoside hydrolase family 43 protein [Clostridia bacterium]
MLTYENPIIPGFYPDPSICRVGEDYYLVNSSFEFYPGVPLWHSRDLFNWKQTGYVLNRKSQLPLEHSGTSGGIYAPTIRYHNGRFYMITTNVSDGGNFFVWTDDINGDWSDPVYLDQGGIDPSIFWDDDGRVYYQGTHRDELDRNCIGQYEFDIETGKRLSETKVLWHGTGGKCPEGPHMYKLNGYYYLLLAEGGTEYGHMVTIGRSKSVWGPFESCPHNPILTHRNHSKRTANFHALGHADIFTDTSGKWWIVFHGIRPALGQLHHIGRETMIAPMHWDENGWPVVNDGKLIVDRMSVDGEGSYSVKKNWYDDFSGNTLAPRWAFLRNPVEASYDLTGDGITLHGTEETLDGDGSPTFVGVRQQQVNYEYETKISVKDGDGFAGITVFHTKEHHYDLLVSKTKNGCKAQLRRRIVDMEMISDDVIFDNTDSLILKIVADNKKYVFLAGTDADNLTEVGSGCIQLMATECMPCSFTGCFAGIFAQGNVTAAFRYFSAKA